MDMYSRYGMEDDLSSYLPMSDFFGFAMGFMLFFLVLSIVAYLVIAFFIGKMFEKAGRNKWFGFVPILNSWIIFELAELPGWLIFIPIVGPLAFYYALYKMGKNFGLSTLQIIGLIFLPLIFVPYIGLSKTIRWQGGNYSTFGGNTPNYQAPVQPTYTEPVQQYQVPVQTAYTEPVQQYQAPVQTAYTEPVQQYQAPVQPTYAEPVQQYQAPVQPTYTEPIQPIVSENSINNIGNQQYKNCPSCGTKVSSESQACFLCGHRFI